MGKYKNDSDTTDTATGTEVGTSDVNFTAATGSIEGLESTSAGLASPSSDSSTSASPVENDGPLTEGAPDALDASKSATDSDDAPSTNDKLDALEGEDADGAGPTHVGTDTPEKLISNPVHPDTGEPLHALKNHSDKPLGFGAFLGEGEDDAG